MRRVGLALFALVLVACGGGSSGDGEQTSVTGGFPAPHVTATPTMASRSIVEPDRVAGLPLGATKDQAQAILGQATTITDEKDEAGRYQTLRWQLSGNRGLALSFRAGSRYSPGLTDWQTNIAGPKTAAGVQVGDAADKAVAAHGPLAPFRGPTRAITVAGVDGSMLITVPDGSGKVELIVGGDPKTMLRSIED